MLLSVSWIWNMTKIVMKPGFNTRLLFLPPITHKMTTQTEAPWGSSISDQLQCGKIVNILALMTTKRMFWVIWCAMSMQNGGPWPSMLQLVSSLLPFSLLSLLWPLALLEVLTLTWNISNILTRLSFLSLTICLPRWLLLFPYIFYMPGHWSPDLLCNPAQKCMVSGFLQSSLWCYSLHSVYISTDITEGIIRLSQYSLFSHWHRKAS